MTFCIMNAIIINAIMNDKKGQNIVKDSFAHKPDGLIVIRTNGFSIFRPKY